MANEADLLLGSQLLVPEQQQVMGIPGCADLAQRRLGERPPEVDAPDLYPQCRRQLGKLDRNGALLFPSPGRLPTQVCVVC